MKTLYLCGIFFLLASVCGLQAAPEKAPAAPAQKEKVELFDWAKFFPSGIMKARQKSSAASVKNLAVLKGKFVILYHSANWCTHCHRFTPELIRFYRKNRKTTEVVFQSGDNSEKAMEEYAKSHKMPWYALPYGKKINNSNAIAMAYPCAIVYAPDGKFFYNILGGPKSSPDPRLKELEQKIKDWQKNHS